MIRALALILWATTASADVETVVNSHILPRADAFAEATATLAATPCEPNQLREAFSKAATAWAGFAHLTMGPVEDAGRGRMVLFWPDSRNATDRGLRLVKSQGNDAWNADTIAKGSIAARGLGALERLIFEDNGEPCALTEALADDLAATAERIRTGWHDDFAPLMLTAGEPDNSRFFTEKEAMGALYTALLTGITYNVDQRLARPLGTFDDPKPLRAELRRSAQSVPMLTASLEALRELATTMTAAPDTEAVLTRVISAAKTLDDPSLSNLSDPSVRFIVEGLQSEIRSTRGLAEEEIGETLDLNEGFNALDGD